MNNYCKQLHGLFNELPRHHFPYDVESIPLNGIYILFEDGEHAHDYDRVVRVGTHRGKNKLPSRLKEHFIKENKDRSIFRKNIGRAMLQGKNDPFLEQWNWDLTTKKIKEKLLPHLDTTKQQKTESAVTKYIQNHISFVVFPIKEKTWRLLMEKTIISTISWCESCRPSSQWLGLRSPKRKIRESGLWQEQGLYKAKMTGGEMKQLKEWIL